METHYISFNEFKMMCDNANIYCHGSCTNIEEGRYIVEVIIQSTVFNKNF